MLRADRVSIEYRISSVSEIPKSNFPTNAVYGDTPGPTLRLITCGGPFDSGAGNYLDNIVAYGEMVAPR